MKLQIVFLLLALSQPYAYPYSLEKACSKCKQRELKLPEGSKAIKTFNNNGHSSLINNNLAVQAFLAFLNGEKTVLEIGGGFGDVMLKALKKNPKLVYIFNDLEEDQTLIAAMRLQKAINQDKAYTIDSRVNFLSGDITQPNKEIEANRYDAILAANVFPFFTPQQLEVFSEKISKLLKPGGRFFAIAMSPYVNFMEKFLPDYKKRVKEGDPFPGYVKNIALYSDLCRSKEECYPSTLMFCDPKMLTRIFKRNGLNILVCKLIPEEFPSANWKFNKEEAVLLIVEKP